MKGMIIRRNMITVTIAFSLMFLFQNSVLAQDNNAVIISGSSNVRDWSCNGKADILVNSGTGIAEPVNGFSDGVSSFEVAVRVVDLKCDKGSRMEDHLKKAMKADSYPDIYFIMRTYELKTDYSAIVNGELTIAGQSREVNFNVQLTDLANNGGVFAEGVTEISMLDYGVKPPEVMFGMIKATPDIKIEFEATLRPIMP